MKLWIMDETLKPAKKKKAEEAYGDPTIYTNM
jgi:hypothetical protein